MPTIATLLVGVLVLWLGVNLVQHPAYFFTISFIGLTNGAVYALVALGYTLVYGILELINFAHGDVFMLGGMISGFVIISLFDLGANPSTGIMILAIVTALAVAMAGMTNEPAERLGRARSSVWACVATEML